MTDFKPGQRVKVYGYPKHSGIPSRGEVGEIISADLEDEDMYRVKFDGKERSFHPRQLEKVKDPRSWVLSFSKGGTLLDAVECTGKTEGTDQIGAIWGGEVIRVREVIE